MALLWIDGSETYKLNDGAAMFNGAYQSGFGCYASNSTPRTGGSCFYTNGDGTNAGFALRNIGSLTSGWMGAGFYPTSASNEGSGIGFYASNAGANNPWWRGDGNPDGFYVDVTSGGQMVVYQVTGGGRNLIFTTTSSPIPSNTWSYVEVFFNKTTGLLQVWLNGIIKIIEITSFPFPGGNYIYAGFGARPNSFCLFDDIYVDSTTQQGAQRVYTLFPNGDQPGNQWAPSSGTTGYNLINIAAYTAGNYIQGAAAGNVSGFSMADLPMANATITGVRLSSVEAIASAGTAQTHKTAVIGSNTLNSAAVSPGTSPATYDAVFNLSGVNVADVNAMVMSITKDV